MNNDNGLLNRKIQRGEIKRLSLGILLFIPLRYEFAVRSETTNRYTHIPEICIDRQIFPFLSPIPQGELNVSLQQRRSAATTTAPGNLTKPNEPAIHVSTRVFPSLLLRVKSIDRLERNRHAYGQTVKKEGGPGKMTKQT